jgi:psiF repeat
MEFHPAFKPDSPNLAEPPMKKLLSLIAVVFAFSAGLSPLAHAADSTAKTPQQNKMATCNKDAEGKKGDERKVFMKECLSAKKELPQQSKMKSCNVEAKDKKGDERKAFMKECLSKPA